MNVQVSMHVSTKTEMLLSDGEIEYTITCMPNKRDTCGCFTFSTRDTRVAANFETGSVVIVNATPMYIN